MKKTCAQRETLAAVLGGGMFDRVLAGARFAETGAPLLYVYARDESSAAVIEDDLSLLIADVAQPDPEASSRTGRRDAPGPSITLQPRTPTHPSVSAMRSEIASSKHRPSCSIIPMARRQILSEGSWRDRLRKLYQAASDAFLPLKKLLLIFFLLLTVPIAASAARYFWIGDGRGNWQTADRSSAGLLPPASEHPDAVIRVFGARTVRWRGIFAVHTWIVVKQQGAPTYSRYDYTAWGEPIRTNGFAPDGRWFGAPPDTIVAVDGERAEKLIPKIRHVVENYKFRRHGDYNPWPGPNSNTFVQAALDSVPELRAVLPPTAIGKDFPYDDRWIGVTPSGTGLYVSVAGYVGLTTGWVEGFEVNFFGAVVGFDVRRPALKLPGLGRLGFAAGL